MILVDFLRGGQGIGEIGVLETNWKWGTDSWAGIEVSGTDSLGIGISKTGVFEIGEWWWD